MYRQDRRPILRLVSGPSPYVHLSKVMDAPRVSYRVGGWVKDCYLSSSDRGEGRPGRFQKGHRFPATKLCYVPIRGFHHAWRALRCLGFGPDVYRSGSEPIHSQRDQASPMACANKRGIGPPESVHLARNSLRDRRQAT